MKSITALACFFQLVAACHSLSLSHSVLPKHLNTAFVIIGQIISYVRCKSVQEI